MYDLLLWSMGGSGDLFLTEYGKGDGMALFTLRQMATSILSAECTPPPLSLFLAGVDARAGKAPWQGTEESLI